MRAVLQISKAANLLGVSIKTIRRWHHAGLIAFVQLEATDDFYSLRFNGSVRVVNIYRTPVAQLFMPGSLPINKNKRAISKDKFSRQAIFASHNQNRS